MEPATTTLIVLKELAGNPPPQLNTIQKILAPHIDLLTNVWISVWIVTAIVLFLQLIHAYKNHRRNK